MKIKIRSLSKRFKDVVAVDNLDIDIEDGELVTLLGPSGCGKSTTLFMIAGLINQDAGSIFFEDQKVDHLKTEERNIGMVFQNYALYPHLTVLRNILFPLEMMKVNKKDALTRAEEVLELLQIKDLVKRKPSQLSGGQQQRVAIARALVKKPKVLLMDEPLSNLDAKLRVETRDEIRKLQKQLSITTIFVTHDQDEAASISDKVLILNNGKLQQYGSPRDIYEKPSNLFTAKFMGSTPINIFDGTCTDKGIFIEEKIVIPYEEKSTNLYNSKVILAVRPENIIVSKKEDASFSGKVEQVDMKGKDNLVSFYMGDNIYRFFASPSDDIKPGDRVFLRFDKERIMLFNPTTYENISRSSI
ncbi:ABC transporter ATP-binding protein [Alkaliphilus peptidifermentans]|uniref:Multiple sugar transport system ATP-binding protein n=1 Tax=Alkaliphilus peptidifermentans DSM 18978 TaxID=1120976 RepID=A0A1G5KLJ9_9FIRM|nr:ABC transporter ATP-binding protein [Alkaliphilus peptidifermentans]SCZ00958.1 multiple sugar transport system ATP-binding protein [Alkaliphilus peptidifermentans DSM 18978]